MNPQRLPAVAKPSGWICPTCRRRFARAKQWHSCKPQTVDVHFVDKNPALRGLFDFLIRKLEKTGPLRIDAVKTSINLISRYHFGGITVRRGYLRVGFLARKPIHSARIIRRQILGPNRVGHSVVVSGKKDVDAELLQWLSDARHLQS
jgi:Domain of unknown function (DUF5655)